MLGSLPSLLALLSAFGLVTGCAVNPVTGRQEVVLMSEQDEIALGNQAVTEVAKEYAPCHLPGLQEYVNQVGQRLAAHSHRPNLQYTFMVVDSPEVNAFALPGGHIYVTRGILAYLNSEAELAGVLGHEIGHVTARHAVRQQTQSTIAGIGAVILGSVLESETGLGGLSDVLSQGATAYVRGYGRDNELEADRLGAEYLARAGYNPQAMVSVVNVLKNQELFDSEVAEKEGRDPRRYHSLFDTHPDADRRLQDVVGAAQRLQAGARDDNRNGFLKATDNLVFGDSPQQGLVRGGAFLHSGLGIGLKFPEGWHLQNGADAVVAVSSKRDALLQMALVPNEPGQPLETLRRRLQPTQVFDAQELTIDGLPAARLLGAKGNRAFQATGIRIDDRLIVFIGLATDTQTLKANLPAMVRATSTFHRLSDVERKQAKAYVIHTATAKRADTFAQLARASPLGPFAEQYLRLINHRYPNGEPEAGQLIKVVH